MRYVTTLTALAAFFVSGIAYGEAESGPNYKHLRPMQWIVGTWVLKTEAPEDAPKNSPIAVKKGDPIKWVMTCKWGLSKNIIETQATLFVKDVLVMTGESRLGWAADKEQIIGSGFDSTGGRGETTFTIVDDNTLKMNQCEVSPDGEITTVTTIVTRTNDDSMRSQRKDITVGGEKKPDKPPVTLQRTK